MLFLLCSIPIHPLQTLPVKTYFTPKILSTCPLLLGHCRQFQSLSVTFYLSLTEGIVWPTERLLGLLNKSRRAKELMPQEWPATWQGPTWGWDSEAHVLDLPVESTYKKQLSSFSCLTVPLPHCASREHLPANFLHQNPDPKVHLGGNLTNTPHSSSWLCLRAVLGMLGAPSSCTLGHASKTQQPPPSHTPPTHVYHAAITFLEQLI